MATVVKELWLDDVDGTEADRSVRFAINGKEYQVDLSEENYGRFVEALQPYVDAGRKVPKTRAKRVGKPA